MLANIPLGVYKRRAMEFVPLLCSDQVMQALSIRLPLWLEYLTVPAPKCRRTYSSVEFGTILLCRPLLFCHELPGLL